MAIFTVIRIQEIFLISEGKKFYFIDFGIIGNLEKWHARGVK